MGSHGRFRGRSRSSRSRNVAARPGRSRTASPQATHGAAAVSGGSSATWLSAVWERWTGWWASCRIFTRLTGAPWRPSRRCAKRSHEGYSEFSAGTLADRSVLPYPTIETARLPRRMDGPSPHRLPGVRGLTPAVLLPVTAARTDPSAVGRPGAPASIPRRSGRTARFTGASAASRIASRSDPSHGMPRRYVGMDEARELAPPVRVEVRTRIVKRLALDCRRSPRNSRSNRSLEA